MSLRYHHNTTDLQYFQHHYIVNIVLYLLYSGYNSMDSILRCYLQKLNLRLRNPLLHIGYRYYRTQEHLPSHLHQRLHHYLRTTTYSTMDSILRYNLQELNLRLWNPLLHIGYRYYRTQEHLPSHLHQRLHHYLRTTKDFYCIELNNSKDLWLCWGAVNANEFNVVVSEKWLKRDRFW